MALMTTSDDRRDPGRVGKVVLPLGKVRLQMGARGPLPVIETTRNKGKPRTYAEEDMTLLANTPLPACVIVAGDCPDGVEFSDHLGTLVTHLVWQGFFGSELPSVSGRAIVRWDPAKGESIDVFVASMVAYGSERCNPSVAEQPLFVSGAGAEVDYSADAFNASAKSLCTDIGYPPSMTSAYSIRKSLASDGRDHVSGRMAGRQLLEHATPNTTRMAYEDNWMAVDTESIYLGRPARREMGAARHRMGQVRVDGVHAADARLWAIAEAEDDDAVIAAVAAVPESGEGRYAAKRVVDKERACAGRRSLQAIQKAMFAQGTLMRSMSVSAAAAVWHPELAAPVLPIGTSLNVTVAQLLRFAACLHNGGALHQLCMGMCGAIKAWLRRLQRAC